MSEKPSIRIRASESSRNLQFSSWVLPEVGSSHVIGLETKEVLPEIDESQVTVLEDEVDSSAHMTLADIEVIREQAYEEGFAKGREDGYKFGEKEGDQRGLQQGLEQGQKLIDARLALLESALISLQDPLEEQRDKVSEVLVEMVEHVAAAVIDFEVKVNPEIVTKAFASALELLPKQAQEVVINVNPADRELIEDAIPRRNSHWQVINDDDISQGGCTIKTGASLIEFQLDSRFQDVVEQLYERLYEDPIDQLNDDSDS
ncbi:MAG: flagellar assembly protein FliH [Oceanospirillaceae bacterium]|nr:flagellar assembly protein FliH [Oceanospirillaceae bacterium]